MIVKAEDATPVAAQLGVRDILAILDIEGDQTAGQVAIDLAQRLDAHVTGLALVYDLYLPFAGYGVLPAEVILDARRAAISQAEAVAKRFEEKGVAAGCRFEARSEDKVFFGDFGEVTKRSRLTDLIVARRDDAQASEPMRTPLIEALLFDSGTPVLVVPKDLRQLELGRALVAWDGSARAAHALRTSLPILMQCREADVLTVRNDSGQSEDAVYVGAYLSRHGIRARVRQEQAVGRGSAETILAVAQRQKADLIIMGAYEHGRFRQHLFGGATFDLLRDSPLPVLMTH